MDAYGTPMSLVEALRADGTVASQSETDDEIAEPEAGDDEESEVDEMALEDDDEEDLDVEEESEVEVVLSVDEEGLAAEPLLSVEDEAIEVSDDIEVESDAELVEEPVAADDDEGLEVAARSAPESTEPTAEVVEPRSGPVQHSLLDVVEEAEPPTKPRSASRPRKTSEPVHVLQPQTAPPPAPKMPVAKPAAAASGSKQASSAKSDPSAEPGATVVDEGLVFRAGCMFLERKRVAVSMLQREFGLDFKQATDVLDQLQSSGLIGPYLGGQRRDILLTPEQWRERVGAR